MNLNAVVTPGIYSIKKSHLRIADGIINIKRFTIIDFSFVEMTGILF
jgi:hypothetical protein